MQGTTETQTPPRQAVLGNSSQQGRSDHSVPPHRFSTAELETLGTLSQAQILRIITLKRQAITLDPAEERITGRLATITALRRFLEEVDA